MKVVLDTNILVSAILYGGKPENVIKLIISEQITGYLSRFIVAELLKTFRTKYGFSNDQINRVENALREIFQISDPTKIPKVITRDISDNQILALADEVKADFIISGDKDIVQVKDYAGIPIVNSDQFLEAHKRNR